MEVSEDNPIKVRIRMNREVQNDQSGDDEGEEGGYTQMKWKG